MAPLAFGPKSASYYKDLKMYGRSLQRILSPNEILTYFDKDLLLKTSYIMCRGPREDLYDPRFVLRLFLSIVHRGTEVRLYDYRLSLVSSNAATSLLLEAFNLFCLH